VLHIAPLIVATKQLEAAPQKMSDPYGMMKSQTNKGQKMTNSEIQNLIADNILARYTPFAFNCECKGEMPECREAMENPYLYGVMDTLTRVSEYIRNFDPTL
jgi:hypothetical protein